jgi:sugar phosphate isomerase/epimerase
MKIAFTTLGCPDWDLDTICTRGKAYGFDGIDLRGLQGNIDITITPEFTTHLAETRAKIADAGLVVSGISSSISICEQSMHQQNIEEAQRTIAVARALQAPSIRVFGKGNIQKQSRAELAAIGQRTMEAILALEGARQVQWLFETHDHWIRSVDCQLLLERINVPEFGMLWDIGHTPRVGQETPAQTLQLLGKRIHYVHVKDAIYDPHHPQAMADGWRYVVPGTGQLPLAEAIRLLRESGYEGWLVFEHEKRWHRELPEPEEIFPQFVEWFRALGDD